MRAIVVVVFGASVLSCRADRPPTAAPPNEITVSPTPTAPEVASAPPAPEPSPAPTTTATATATTTTRTNRPAAAKCEKMRLVIAEQTKGQYTTFVGTLFNDGKQLVRLVEPGDGSESGWRTPTVSWIVKTLNGQQVSSSPGARCGNMNPIQESEIFDLAPGEKRMLGPWFGGPYVPAGKYVVKAVYDNDPSSKTAGIPLGTHDDIAMELIRRSTACRVESNTLTVDIATP